MHERRFIPTPLLQTWALYQIPHHAYFAIECQSCGVVKDIAREYLQQAGAYSSLKELSPRFRCTVCGEKNARIMAGGGWSDKEAMSSTTDFIAELFRAANQIGTLTSFERVRLIERAAATIQAQRDLLATKERVLPLTYDVTANLEKMKAQAPEMPEVLSAVVMLKCADEIRRLRILLETDQR